MLVHRIPAYLSLIAVFFFSYTPFFYILPYIRMRKETIFFILLSLNFAVLLFIFLIKGKIKISKDNRAVISLYLLFIIYAVLSYVFIGNHSNDLFTLRTLIVINPIFLIFAIINRDNKKDIIKATFFLASIYFVFLMLSIKQGDILSTTIGVRNIFSGIDDSLGTYQNINMYIGLFVISCLYFFSKRQRLYKVAALLMIILSIIGMFLIGARASVLALAVVLIIYHLNTKGARKRFLKITVFITAVVTASVFWTYIGRFFQQSITASRFIALFDKGDPSFRIQFFTEAIKIFLTNGQTILFGAGIDSFPISIGLYPHNVFLELLSNYGIVGTTFFVFPIAYVFIVRKRKIGSWYGNSLEENLLFLFFIYFLVIDMFTGALRGSWMFIFFSFLLLPTHKTKQRSSTSDSHSQRLGKLPVVPI